MNQKQLEDIGIDYARGGRVQVIAGQLASLRESTNKDTHQVSIYAEIAYFGGTESIRVEPGHALTKVPIGSECIIAYSWTDSKWGPRPHEIRLMNGAKQG